MPDDRITDWHCVARGVRKSDIFCGDEDKEFYLRQLARLTKELALSVAMYILMDNHFHFLIRAGRRVVGKLFLRAHTVYAREFNRRHGFRGRMFECHFRPYPIEGTLRLAAASLYIPMNAVKDLGFSRPQDYGFSSYRWLFAPDSAPDWIDMSPVLEVFSPDPEEARRTYVEAVEARRAVVARNRRLYAIPPSQVKPRLLCEYSDPEIRMMLDSLLVPELKHRLSQAALLPSEAFTLYAASKLNLAPFRRLAMLLGISASTGRRYVKEIAGNEDLDRMLNSTSSLFEQRRSVVAQER